MGCKRLNTDFFTFLEVVHSEKSAPEEKKRINYYPFGLKHKGYNSTISSNGNSTAQKFGYNGKELEEELGLNTLDYGNRSYNAAIGRFNRIDRFAQKYMNKSPYHYGANNPILYADKAGDSIIVSTKAKLYNGIRGNTTSVRSKRDLGETALLSTVEWNYNETTKEVDANFYVQQNFTPLIQPGTTNKFLTKNPGIRREVFAHEDGHRDQYSESILESTDFKVTIDTDNGEKEFSGGIQSILDGIYTDHQSTYADDLKDIMSFGIGEEEAKNSLKDVLNDKMNQARYEILKSIDKKMDALNSDKGHSDANERSYKYLGGKKKSKYNSGRKSIIFWGFGDK